VKIIEEQFLNQDPKGRENLEREISIMKLLKGCDNVVQIFFAGVRPFENLAASSLF